MAKLLRALLLLGLIAVISWLAVVAYWQTIHLAPAISDIVLWLALLPLALWCIALLALRLWRKPAAAPITPPAPTPATTTQTAHRALQIYAAHFLTPLGNDASSLIANIASELVPSLDSELTDLNGFPLPARRYADLDTDPVSHMAEVDSAQGRSLALLAELITQLSPELAQLDALYGQCSPTSVERTNAAILNPAWHGQVAESETRPARTGRLPSLLKLQWLTDPAEAGDDTQRIWLSQQLRAAGIASNLIDIEVRPMPANGLIQHLAAVVDTLATHPEPVLLLIVASASNIAQSRVDGWLEAGLLATGQLQFPGEAAAAILLGNPAVDLPDWPSMAQLHLPQHAECEPQTRQRPHLSQTLSNLMMALQANQPLPTGLQWLCSGLALGPEAIEVAPLLANAAEPKQIDEAVHLRSAVGDAGVAGALSAYALAAQCTAKENQPTLLVLNDGHLNRGLCLFEPTVVAA